MLHDIHRKLDRILELLERQSQKENSFMSDITDSVATLTATVAAVETKDASILAYVQGVPALITAAVQAANGDATAAVANINALAASLATSPDAILAAINANTAPPAPAPVPAP